VLTMIAGRLASRTCRPDARRLPVRLAVGYSIALGALFAAVDLGDALAGKGGVEQASRWIRHRDPRARIYFSGGGSFEFYAPRMGMEPMISDRTRLEVGDWLVIESRKQDDRLCYRLDEKAVSLETMLVVSDLIPLTTLHYFYIGARPIETRDGPRAKIFIYRIVSPIAPSRLVEKGRVLYEAPLPMAPRLWSDLTPSTNP